MTTSSRLTRTKILSITRDRVFIRGRVFEQITDQTQVLRWVFLDILTQGKDGNVGYLRYRFCDPGEEAMFRRRTAGAWSEQCTYRLLLPDQQAHEIDELLRSWRGRGDTLLRPEPILIVRPWQSMGTIEQMVQPSERCVMQHLYAAHALLWNMNRAKADGIRHLMLERLGGFIHEQNQALRRVTGT